MPLSVSSALFLSPIITTFVTIFAGLLTTSFSDDVTYSNCHRTFSCGSLRNISYPFTGGDRPYHCGPPEFRLSCRDNYTEFTTNSLTYRILNIDQTQQTMALARVDLWNNTCPNQFINTTRDSTIFSYGIGNQDLNLIYGCNASGMTLRPQNLFTCNVNASDFSDAYYLVGEVPTDPILGFINCTVSVTVPILRIAGDRLMSNRTTLENVLMEGFNVNYSDPYGRRCSQCTQFSGQCGFDSNLGEPICICGGRLCPLAPLESPPPPAPAGNGSSENQNRTPLGVGLGLAGAAFAGIGVGWVIFFCRQRRKRLAAQAAESAQTESKDILTPSSKGLTTTSIHFTQNTPSHPSLESEFGKSSTYFGVQVFSYTELEEATDNFDRSRELGDGGFGTVYYGKLHDGRIVAVKRLYENNFKRVEQFMNEVEILTRLRHQNLVMLFGCTSKRSRELLLVYEYIPNGTVADHLNGKLATVALLSWPVRLNIAIETADALTYLHASDIIHRDVKTNNILLDNDFHVKVADFGLSRLFPNDVTHVSTAPQGTPGYVDPEYYQCYQLTEKSDVYSFGVVLVELISSLQAVDTNRHRHDINLANMAINKIQNHALHELVDPTLGFHTDSSVKRMTTLVAELAFRCLQQERDMRPSMQEVLEGLRGIHNEELNVQKVEVVDILVDDMGLLESNSPPLSPVSMVTDKLVSNSTPNSSG